MEQPPSSFSPTQRDVVDRAIALLRDVVGVRAIVLGGSYATGRNRANSDIDLAIYYSESQPLDIDGVRRVANELSAIGPVDVTELYGWGQWVNGGGWLMTRAGRIDFLYRNIEQVERSISDADRGVIHHDYAQQPPTGFYSVTYLGETHVCVPLHDPHRVIAELKQTVAIYPPAMKDTIIRHSLSSAEFTLICLPKYVVMSDVYNTVACFTRIFANLTQAIYALNEKYFVSDKAVGADLIDFHICPRDYFRRAANLLVDPGRTKEQLEQSRDWIHQIWMESVQLYGKFQPRFSN